MSVNWKEKEASGKAASNKDSMRTCNKTVVVRAQKRSCRRTRASNQNIDMQKLLNPGSDSTRT